MESQWYGITWQKQLSFEKMTKKYHVHYEECPKQEKNASLIS
jgi:hypothetical protein